MLGFLGYGPLMALMIALGVIALLALMGAMTFKSLKAVRACTWICFLCTAWAVEFGDSALQSGYPRMWIADGAYTATSVTLDADGFRGFLTPTYRGPELYYKLPKDAVEPFGEAKAPETADVRVVSTASGFRRMKVKFGEDYGSPTP